jgi:hypothetical protein
MPKPDNTYRLVIFDQPEDPPAVRDLLCSVSGIHPTDAMQWVARTPGVWPQPLAEGEVRELLDGLFNLGVAAEAWRIDVIPNLSPPRTIHIGACLPDGFRAGGLHGEPTHWVPWDKVELISAGRIMLEDEFRDVSPPAWVAAVATGLNALLRRPQAIARRQRAMRIPHDPVGEVIIVRREPRLAFRIVANKMNYAYLGDRLQTSATENFRTLVGDLCQHSSEAYITQSTQAFLDRGKPENYEFASSHALLDYATHRLLWSWYRRDRDRDQETEVG